ncbi:hypothetical protein B0A53_05514 [Rhodotorula sp. CCFEE 5036]|nr:hypothetical protein B0A53_05514 [Rhodotorula sp. CCFEE 5036]
MSFQSEHPTRPPDRLRHVNSDDDAQECSSSPGGTRSASLHREPLGPAAAIDISSQLERDDPRLNRPAPDPAEANSHLALAPSIPDYDSNVPRPPISKSRFATSTSGTQPPLPAHADRHEPQIAPTVAGTPSSPTQTPRMRRVPRQSPNARNERPAPSTLASSRFAAANLGSGSHPTASSTLSSSSAAAQRSLRRRSSMPSVASRRVRASSLDAPSTSTATSMSGPNRGIGASSGSGPSRRDPDEHWLSEDEAADTVRSANRLRQPLRRRRSGSDDGSDAGEGGRKVLHATDLGIDSVPGQQIHHRPAKHFNLAPDASAEPDAVVGPALTELVPQLAKTLTCPSCHRLFTDPATLACGHSRCLHCAPAPAAEHDDEDAALYFAVPHAETMVYPLVAPQQPAQLATPAFSGVPSPLPSPAVAAHLNAGTLYRTLSSTSIASTPSIASVAQSVAPETSAPSLPILCADPDCNYNFSHLIVPHRPLRIDYTLRKLVDILRRAVFGIDDYVAAVESRSAKERNGEVLTPLFSSVRLGSEVPMELSSGLVVNKDHSSSPEPGVITRGDSGSSGGGEDEPIVEDESKRARKSTGTWRSSKKSRPVFDLDDSYMTPAESASKQTHSSSSSSSTLPRLALISPSLVSDLQAECECQVCFQLFHEPVTSPCGHSFCRGCLARAYDHSDKCPLCRADLPPLAYFRWQRSSANLDAVMTTAMPKLAAERAAAVKEDERALLAQVPIFICTSAWPGIKCFLHIFEPRYRLMIRRVLETPDRSFGMLLPVRNASTPDAVNEYGTMLRITSCQMLEDGRLILETIGTYRFRLLERTMVDGYNVGRVERVDDVSPEQEAELEAAALAQNDSPEFQEAWSQPDDPATAPTIGGARPARPPMTGNVELSIDQLMEICLDFIRTLRAQSAPWIIERLNRTVGEMPTNPHDFSWFAAEVFPVEDHVKVVLLQITSVRERLRLIVFWIEQFRSSWWYTRGFV